MQKENTPIFSANQPIYSASRANVTAISRVRSLPRRALFSLSLSRARVLTASFLRVYGASLRNLLSFC